MTHRLELAATKERTLSCDAITREIECEIDYLSVTTRDMPDRQEYTREIFARS